MTRPLLRVGETGIPPETLARATEEVQFLHDSTDLFEKFVTDNHQPSDPRTARHIDWAIPSFSGLEELYESAPTMITILDQFGAVRDRRGNLLHFPAGFTTNLTEPGQVIPKHTDEGNKDKAHTTRIVNLSGKGRFILMLPGTSDEIARASISTGQQHEFDNPADFEQRFPHMAINTGDTTRISLAFCIPHDILLQNN